jgi:hypothetical protein
MSLSRTTPRICSASFNRLLRLKSLNGFRSMQSKPARVGVMLTGLAAEKARDSAASSGRVMPNA